MTFTHVMRIIGGLGLGCFLTGIVAAGTDAYLLPMRTPHAPFTLFLLNCLGMLALSLSSGTVLAIVILFGNFIGSRRQPGPMWPAVGVGVILALLEWWLGWGLAERGDHAATPGWLILFGAAILTYLVSTHPTRKPTVTPNATVN
jgi:hypothetical protein